MTKTVSITIFATLLLCQLVGQVDSLNRFDNKGKKVGFWVIYLDNRLNPTDSLNSYFKGYEYYDAGQKAFGFKKAKWRAQDSMTYDNEFPIKGSPILVSGVFKWYYKGRKNPFCSEEYQNGYPKIFMSFQSGPDPNKSYVFELVDFTKRYNDMPGTNYNELHNPYDNTFKKFWYYKTKRRWTSHRIKD